MQEVQKIPIFDFKYKNSLECNCEKNNLTCKKCFLICDICSEKNYIISISKDDCSKFVEWVDE